MKSIQTGLMLMGLAGLTVAASPLPKDLVAADAKWVVHLDVEQFARGKVGSYLVEKVLNPRSAEMKEGVKEAVGLELDWKKIQSITAFGTGYQPQDDDTGLLLIRTSMDVKGALDAATDKGVAGFNLSKVENSPSPMYQFAEQGFVSLPRSDLLMVARHRSAIDRGLKVMGGQAENFSAAKGFQEYPEASFGFFLLAVAEGFGQQADLPASAAIFKQATGARVVLGEEKDRLRLNFDLKAATPEVGQQIQQVAQGLLALAAMNADQNPDLKKLTQSAAVTSAGKCVTLAVTVPIADVIAKIDENQSAP